MRVQNPAHSARWVYFGNVFDDALPEDSAEMQQLVADLTEAVRRDAPYSFAVASDLLLMGQNTDDLADRHIIGHIDGVEQILMQHLVAHVCNAAGRSVTVADDEPKRSFISTRTAMC